MILNNYIGNLLAAHPKRPRDNLSQGVVIVLRHDESGAVGLQINKPFTNGATLTSVMENLNIPNNFDDDLLYVGGDHATNRIYVIHTLDWFSTTTVRFDDQNIGISGDISIIAALSKGQGPSQFRAVAGFFIWEPGQLEEEIAISDSDSLPLSWSWTPSTVDLVFDTDSGLQWRRTIEAASKLQVANWF
jgi:putative AlgH/UPF0301 family transcriptional regulator